MDERVSELIENISNASFQLGKVAMLEEFSKNYMMDFAKKYFVLGEDKIANIFRDGAKKLMEKAKKERETYNSESKTQKEEDWKVLEHLIPENLLRK